MAVSWDPNWQVPGTASDLTIPSPSATTSTPGPGYDVVAVGIYGGTTNNGNGTITDPGDLTEYLSQYESAAGTLASRFYLLARPASDDDIHVVTSHGALGIAGFFPRSSAPSWLEPHSSTAVPGESGEFYGNPFQINNTNPSPPFTIPVWVPVLAGGIDAGIFFSATSGGSIATYSVSSPEADTDYSMTQTAVPAGSSDRVQIGMFAVENAADDPAEIAVNAGNASERRWVAVLGFGRGARWTVGSVGWS